MNKYGIVYALINPAMPGYIKIGKTTRSVEERINELSNSTGVPHKYICAYSIEVSDCHVVEKNLHEYFSKYRVNNNREFFNIELQEVIGKMLEYQNEFSISEEEISDFELGVAYYYGINGYSQNLFEARKHLERSLEQGYYKAYIYIAKMQNIGEAGFVKSFNDAIETLNLAIENKIEDAYAELALLYSFDNDNETAIIFWENYMESENIDEYNKPVNYFYYIRCCYYINEDAKYDYKLKALKNEIMKFFLKLSIDEIFEEDPDFYAFLDMTLGYFTANEINILKQEVYSEIEDDNCDNDNYQIDNITTFDIGENYYYGFEENIKDDRIALKYFKQAIRENDFRACYHIGNMYLYGEAGLKESTDKAIENFILGIENGISDCYAELAKIYNHEENYENAYKAWINYMSKETYSFEWSISGNYLDYIYYCYRKNKKVNFIEKITSKKQDIYVGLQHRIQKDSNLKIDVDFFEFLKSEIGVTELQELIDNYYPNIENGKKYNKYGYDIDGVDKRGFKKDGFNVITKSGYDEYGYDINGYFRNTNSKYNEEGYNKDGYDRSGYDREGYNRLGHDKNGFKKNGHFKYTNSKYNSKGYDKDGFDIRGFNIEGIHKVTKTKYNPEGYDKDGYDIKGFNNDRVHKLAKKEYKYEELIKDNFNNSESEKNYSNKNYNLNKISNDSVEVNEIKIKNNSQEKVSFIKKLSNCVLLLIGSFLILKFFIWFS